MRNFLEEPIFCVSRTCPRRLQPAVELSPLQNTETLRQIDREGPIG